MSVNRRHPGMDVLRPLAMLMLVAMHFFMLSGVFESTNRSPVNYAFSVFGKAFCGTALNCFWLISGYFLCESKSLRWGRFFGLWGWTLFYSLISFGALALLGRCDSLDWHAVFPVYFNIYWFVDIYLSLLLVMPAVNAAISALSQKAFRDLLLVLYLLTSILPVVGFTCFDPGPFSLGWAIVMYLTGAYIRQYDPFACFRGKRVFVLPLCAAAMLIAALAANFVTKGAGQLFDYSDYGFPATAAFSIALFVMFDKLGVREDCRLHRAALMISPYVFGVYVIHVSPFFLKVVWPVVTGSDFHSPLFILRFAIGVPLMFLVTLSIDAACYRLLAVITKRWQR